MGTEFISVLKVLAIFIVLVILIGWKRKLYIAMIGGIIATILLFGITPYNAAATLAKQTLAFDTISTLVSFYLIIFIQVMLDYRGRLKIARDAFNRLIRNPRLNAMVSPSIMGLLPSAAIMTVCAEMTDEVCHNYMDKKTMTFVSSYYRHIPEMFLPSYPAILLCLVITGMKPAPFILAMLPLVLMSYAAVYFIYMRKLPWGKDVEPPMAPVNTSGEIKQILLNLWTLAAVVAIIVIFNAPVYIAALPVILVNFLIDRFKLKDISGIAIKSAEPVLLGNMYLIMLFKGILSYTGALSDISVFFNSLPIPIIVSFTLLFLVGTIVSGSQAMVALGLPMALAAIPGMGLPELVIFMGTIWAAMQISPTHVCLMVATRYFGTSYNDVTVKGLFPVIIVTLLSFIYGTLLKLII